MARPCGRARRRSRASVDEYQRSAWCPGVRAEWWLGRKERGLARGALRQVGDHAFGVSDGGAQLGLAGLVAVDDGTAELVGAAVNILEESLALWRLVELVGGDESESNADDEPQYVLHENYSLVSGKRMFPKRSLKSSLLRTRLGLEPRDRHADGGREPGEFDERTAERRGEKGDEGRHVAGRLRDSARDGVDPDELLVGLADGRRRLFENRRHVRAELVDRVPRLVEHPPDLDERDRQQSDEHREDQRSNQPGNVATAHEFHQSCAST